MQCEVKHVVWMLQETSGMAIMVLREQAGAGRGGGGPRPWWPPRGWGGGGGGGGKEEIWRRE